MDGEAPDRLEAFLTLTGRGLVCNYGPTRAVDGLDVDVSRDEILAVFGPNGAGKTTLLKALSGERRPDDGQVFLDGREVNGSDPAWRSRLGLVSHRTGLYLNLTVVENLCFFAAMRGLATSSHAAAEALEAAGAVELARFRAESLSRGQRQRVALARSLLHDPDILFLDEPFTGLDPEAAAALEAALLERRSPRRIVVLVTHDIGRGLRLADRVMVMRRGRRVLAGRADRFGSDALLAAFAGRAGGGPA